MDGTNYRVSWSFEDIGIFLELVAAEKLAGNFGGRKTETPKGYKNVIEDLRVRIGIKNQNR